MDRWYPWPGYTNDSKSYDSIKVTQIYPPEDSPYYNKIHEAPKVSKTKPDAKKVHKPKIEQAQ